MLGPRLATVQLRESEQPEPRHGITPKHRSCQPAPLSGGPFERHGFPRAALPLAGQQGPVDGNAGMQRGQAERAGILVTPVTEDVVVAGYRPQNLGSLRPQSGVAPGVGEKRPR
ncbi:hypothetical protein ACFVX9_03870 [Kitasatospora sp. NPDC058243]|uniref:hypothetical protein n=1 Tax=Kitasatospora sp. NPDC058243 TaxID=3346397 RepID=UPI0036DC5DE9